MRVLSTAASGTSGTRELFAVAAVLFVLGTFVLEGLGALALFGSLIAFCPGIMRRLSGEEVSTVEGGRGKRERSRAGASASACRRCYALRRGIACPIERNET